MPLELLDELAGALVGEEQPGARKLDEAADVGQRGGEPVRPLDVEEAVARAPDDEGRRRHAPQRRLGREQVAGVQRSQPTLEPAGAFARPEDRVEEPAHDLEWELLDGFVA